MSSTQFLILFIKVCRESSRADMKLLKRTGEGVPGEGTKSGSQNIGLVLPVLVALPLVEHLPGVHDVQVVHVAVPGQVHHEDITSISNSKNVEF